MLPLPFAFRFTVTVFFYICLHLANCRPQRRRQKAFREYVFDFATTKTFALILARTVDHPIHLPAHATASLPLAPPPRGSYYKICASSGKSLNCRASCFHPGPVKEAAGGRRRSSGPFR